MAFFYEYSGGIRDRKACHGMVNRNFNHRKKVLLFKTEILSLLNISNCNEYETLGEKCISR